ncbi:azurin [Lysobacter concretionis Ko07 = DSM 16239]|jgi:azurin|uniref:Azurin n=1 Tax=Lysobacter concretionis Ko07 = DSM 16239 TaxID=1122185 RepID=A0A0A0EKM0_9GAMM|nr:MULTISPECIES: azurin [Lysobacter]KGM51551.1 azurin [Lysobacter concretionis Ko07 = DSM 16239]QOD90640.1 azurin [Lysobacter sp. CW239]
MIRKLSAVALLGVAGMFALPAMAANCAATVDSNDAMQFTTKSLQVPASCKEFKVTLKHVGQLPKTVMGHNFVLGKTADVAGINADGMKAGADANYVKAGDPRVIAASKLIGGGESTTVTIPVAKLKAGEDYTYFCSFPGHAGIMKGSLTLSK